MSAADEARAEAERRYPADAKTIGGSAQNRRNFIAGAEWQASRPISDVQVAAAARAIHDIDKGKAQSEYGVTLKDWERLDDEAVEEFFEYARAALEAASGVQS